LGQSTACDPSSSTLVLYKYGIFENDDREEEIIGRPSDFLPLLVIKIKVNVKQATFTLV
jgi:hypothetical protein